jgi:mannosyltransferase OCH1-like enzyme
MRHGHDLAGASSFPVFAYWHSEDQDVLAPLIAEWREAFPAFRVLGDREVVPLLARHFPDSLEAYQRVRIPAARADLARLIALYEFGGLYVDCHCTIRNRGALDQLIGLLPEYDGIFVDKLKNPPPLEAGEDPRYLLNSIIFSPRRSVLIHAIAKAALDNCAQQWALERSKGFVQYDIWCLTGPRVINRVIYSASQSGYRPEFANRILRIREEDAPISRYRHYNYRGPGTHWSERQRTEPLFG